MIEEIYRHNDRWIEMASVFLDDETEAEDLVQDMYLKLLENKKYMRNAYKNDKVNNGYIFIMLRNAALDVYKKKSRMFSVELDEILELEGDINEDEDMNNLRLRVDNFVKNEIYLDLRHISELKMEGMSYRQIADEVGISYMNVYNRFKKVEALIKKYID